MSSTLLPHIQSHFEAIVSQSESLCTPDAHHQVTFRAKSPGSRGVPDGTWVWRNTSQIADFTVFGVVTDADMTSYGTGAGAKNGLEVCSFFEHYDNVN